MKFNAELRSSSELLTELQKAEGGESCLGKSKTGIQETGAALSISHSQASFITQRTILKRKWKVIPANSSYGGALSVAVSKMVTRMVRHYDQDERQSDAALHWDTMRQVLLKPFAKHGAQNFSEKHWFRLSEGSRKTRVECCEDAQKSLAYFRAIQRHSGGILIDPELMVHIRIPYHWKEYIFHRGRSFCIQPLRTD